MTRSFDLAILNADLSARLIVPGLKFSIDSFKHSVNGGPDSATVYADGDSKSRRALVDYAGYPVEILDAETGAACWWGYINEATTVDGQIERGASIADMANRVAVAYMDSAGARQTTAWSDDIDSQSRYGIKERLEHLTTGNSDQAEALRDQTLAYFKRPLPILRSAVGGGERATLDLKGWYSVLDWRYYAADEDVIENPMDWDNVLVVNTGGGTSGSVGSHVEAPFTADKSFTCDRVYISANSGPWHPNTRHVYVRICADDAGGSTPGTELGAHDMVADYLQWAANWTEFILDTSVDIVDGTTYWIQIEYNQGWPEYIQINCKVIGGRITPFYQIAGTREHTIIIQNALTYSNQFVVAEQVDATSGLQRTAYRAGDETVMAVIDQLLGCGVAGDNRRLLGMVMRDRVLRVFEEPVGDALSAPYRLGRDGQLRFQLGGEIVPPSISPAGAWCAVEGEEPPLSAVASQNPDLSAFFIDAAAFNAADDRWELEPRGTISPYDFYQAVER